MESDTSAGDDGNGSAAPHSRRLSDTRLLLAATVIGIVGAGVAMVYYAALRLLSAGVWTHLLGVNPHTLPVHPAWRPSVILVTTAAGLVVGLLTKWLGSAGELAAVVDNIHLHDGRIDIRQTPSMATVSLVGIAAGGSAGPEAPLVQIIGSIASRLGDRLQLPGEVVRTFTFCGMGAALGAFFGAPLGGALFALEVPHRRGIEYYESLLPTLLSAFVAYLIFRAVVGVEPVLFHLPEPLAPLRLTWVIWGLAAGIIGAGAAWLFTRVFYFVGRLTHRVEHRPVALATAGGLLIGGLAQLCPLTLFWGEFQIDAVIHHAGLLLLAVAVLKMLAIAVTLHSGFRGGFIFPLMFIGACVGSAAATLMPAAPAAAVIIGTMAGVNVAVTKTPLSTCVILCTLSGASLLPVLVAASLASLILSTRLNLIRTQRSRVSAGPAFA